MGVNFIGLDAEFNVVKYLNPLNIQWRRRYYSFGDFEIQLLKDDYESSIKYILHSSNKEVAIVNKVDYTQTNTGKTVSISGYFIEFVLCDANLKSSGYTDDYVETICRESVQAMINYTNLVYSSHPELKYHMALGNKLGLKDKMKGSPDIYTELGVYLYQILEDCKVSQRLKYNGYGQGADVFEYELWQGVDRTDDVIFSDTMGDIASVELVEDDSNYKNFALVYLEEPDTMKQVSLRKDTERIKLLSMLAQPIENVEEKTQAQIDAELEQQGTLELLNHLKITNIKFDALPRRYRYKTDYDLGDIITVVIDDLQKEYSYRITEIYEIYKNGNREIQLTVGDEKIKQFKKGRLY